jgi:hypothetical protein
MADAGIPHTDTAPVDFVPGSEPEAGGSLTSASVPQYGVRNLARVAQLVQQGNTCRK